MKEIIILFLLALTVNVFSQDLILTNDGDSIDCRITKETKEYIYFTFKHKDGVRKTLIANSDVIYHQTDYFQRSEVTDEELKTKVSYQHFRIALNGGYSYRTAKLADNIPNNFRDYTKELKSGYHLAGDITYYFSEPLGVGVKVNNFNSSNRAEVSISESTGYVSGEISDNINILFVGPSFNTRLFDRNKRNAFLMSLAIGYLDYSNEARMITPMKIKGSTVGMVFDLGYDICLSDNYSLGFQISLLSGTLTKYELSEGMSITTIKLEEEEYESLGRIDFSIGIRFHK